MDRGSVKRATLFLGLASVCLGLTVLFWPIYTAGIECGASVLPEKQRVAPHTYVVPGPCDAPIRRFRWAGAAILLAGTVVVFRTGTRCLVTDEPTVPPGGRGP